LTEKPSLTTRHHTYSGASGYIHDTELTNLNPDTIYYFICGSDTTGWSAEKKFRTAPTHPTSINFIVACDCRTNIADRDMMMRAMIPFNPSFFLLGGDIVEVGTTQSLWDDFFTKYESIMVDSNGFTIPIVPAIGNHEGNAINYYDQFALPNNEQWYSLDYGDLLHMIILSTETTVTGTQQSWLQSNLASSTSYMWKLALFHQPPYCAGSTHYSNIDVRNAWCPSFDQYHVQITVAGHNHNYERSLPVYNGAIVPSYSSGTMYVTSGSFGAPLRASGTDWWTAYSESIYEFCVIKMFSNKTMTYDAKNNLGATLNNGGEFITVTTP
jgi:hypothetical protein